MLLGNQGPSARFAMVAVGASGIFTVVLGFTVMVGWLLRADGIVQVRPHFAAMEFNTALGLSLCGLALLLRRASRFRNVVAGIGFGSLVVGLIVLFQYAAGVTLPIDELFVDHYIQVGTAHPGRMAPNTAAAFVLMGINLLLLARVFRPRRRVWICGLVTVLVIYIAVESLLGYATGIASLYTWGNSVTMAPHVAVGFAVLGYGSLVDWRLARRGTAHMLRHSELSVLLGGLAIAVLMWRGLEEQIAGPSALPEIAFVASILGASLFAAAVYLGQQATLRARETERLLNTVRSEVAMRERAESALRESEELAERILNGAHEAFIATTETGVITDWNHEAEATFGWTKDEALGKRVEDIIMPDEYRVDMTEAREDFVRTGSQPLIGTHMELLAKHRDGHHFPVEASITPIDVEQGYLFAAFIRDITERKRSAQDLARSNEELRQFAYVASHDLQEPLRMVTSYLQLLQRRYGGQLDVDADEFIGFAVDGASRMKALINDLLEYSRVGTRGVTLAPTDAQAVFESVLMDLKIAIVESGVRVTCDPLPTILADSVQLKQLLQNLVANAIKFSKGDSPEVHVSVDRRGPVWVFSVVDNGIGVDPRYAERIFSVFERLHTPEEYPGTGIGLAICRKIVERHGGRIWVSPITGEGSTFCFTIPYAGKTTRPDDRQSGAPQPDAGAPEPQNDDVDAQPLTAIGGTRHG